MTGLGPWRRALAYWVRRHGSIALGGFIAVGVLLGGCGGQAQSPVRVGGSGATSVQPTQADLSGLAAAWNSYGWRSSTYGCTVEVVPSTVREALDASTGTLWAIATIKPPDSCNIPDGRRAGVFYEQANETGVFQKLPGGQWTMNSPASDPFPCGPSIGVSTGPSTATPNSVPPTNPPGLTTPTNGPPPVNNQGPLPTSGLPVSESPSAVSTTVLAAPGPDSPTLPVDVLQAMGFNPNPACADGIEVGG